MAYVEAPPEFKRALYSWEKDELVVRDKVYILPPKEFEISGCPKCKSIETEWSEFWGHSWCPFCLFDFRPEHGGVFDGPVPINACEMMGIYFDTIDSTTHEIEPGPIGILHFRWKDGIVNGQLEYIPAEERLPAPDRLTKFDRADG